MANIERRDKIVTSIARIQAWAKKDGTKASEEQVHEQVTRVKSRWLSFQAENKEVLESCGPVEVGFHVDVEKNTEQLYMETLQVLLDLLRSHSEAIWSDATTDNATADTNTDKGDASAGCTEGDLVDTTAAANAKSPTGTFSKQGKQQRQTTLNMDQRERIQPYSIHKLGISRLYERSAHFVDSTLAALQTYLDMLEDYWHGYMDHINVNYIGNDINADITETETFYMDTKTVIRGLLNNMATAPVGVRPAAALGARLKLPPIQIGKFDGDFQHWTAFHDLFTKMVDQEASLSGAQKLYYLKQCVQGDAEKLIRSYQISDANYLQAWNALKARYKSKRQIANSTFRTLFGLSKLATESASSIRAQLDTFLEAVNQLHSLGMPTQEWDDILVFMFAEKLDLTTRRYWELSLTEDEFPSLRELHTFLETRARSLQACGTTISTSKSSTSDRSQNYGNRKIGTTKAHHSTNSSSSSGTSSGTKCPICCSTHFVFSCPEFIKKTTRERYNLAVEHHLCFNCLRGSHSTKSCTSGRCRTCNSRHHTLLHYQEQRTVTNELPTRAAAPEDQEEPKTVAHVGAINQRKKVLLATAVARVRLPDGSFQKVRILLDSGSQTTFITENCVRRLHLERTKASIAISGLGDGHAARTRGLVQLLLQPHFDSDVIINLEALVLERITSHIPNEKVCKAVIPHLAKIVLADPDFNIPNEVDILIGADGYGKLLLDEIITGTDCEPTAQKTSLGWVLFGPVISKNATLNLHSITSLHSHLDLASSLLQFWELEAIRPSSALTQAEKRCEDYFNSTYHRDSDGRYVVNLPFNDNLTPLGDSLGNAIKSLQNLERRFAKSPQLKAEYSKFIEEYISLGHMEETERIGVPDTSFYLPHHPVFKKTGNINKIRVVFDASRKTTAGISLNDKLMVGPRLQDDLVDVLQRFRKHKIAFTCDIAKMYRQILVHVPHREYQRIVWRDSTQQPIRHFLLKTVTYGTSAASYLATKSLQQLAWDESTKYPLASKVCLTDFYVDDLMTGCHSVSDALTMQNQLIALLLAGGMELRKWSSNSDQILKSIPVEHRERATPLEIGNHAEDAVKTLGLFWFHKLDVFGYKVQVTSYTELTKRKVLSEVAKIFDPLGFLAPVIITAKVFMQTLWISGVAWDDRLSDSLAQTWITYRQSLHNLDAVKVHRFLGTSPGNKYQLHGFCDSSEVAYGAVVYLRTTRSDGSTSVRIIAAKTKVAPIKKVSLPRLELCGALLLAQLLVRIKSTLGIESEIFAWTDSTVVLAWLRKPSHCWQTFVANRIAEIQSVTSTEIWHHVSGVNNPADCASRGITPAKLLGFDLWWSGPSWLSGPQHLWPKSLATPITNIDEKRQIHAFLAISPSFIDKLLAKCSTLRRMKRIMAYVRRFIQNSRFPTIRRSGLLTVEELDQSLLSCIKLVQRSAFKSEIKQRSNGENVRKGSPLKRLDPVLDNDGLLKLGGRLASAHLNYDNKHQIIIPKLGRLTRLIIADSHKENLHSGTQLTLSNLRQKYWILGSRCAVKYHIRRCVTCVRHARNTANQIMANLPARRVQPGRPFLTSGVDYAGPFVLRQFGGRCKRFTKGYIAIFVCFPTKATHLELVSDLSTAAFLAALRRFFARRGRCANIYSDCGTNFVGANRELREFRDQLLEQLSDDYLANTLANDGINWHFIPPGSPTFGGLWEAGVKQVKHHLRRVVGNHLLTFEEMATVLAQIEAVLNSRPLCALSDDPEDLASLTPGHFLIGEPMNSFPEPDVSHVKLNRLSRWQLLQQIVQSFWSRWQSEYLATLQQRNKWLFRTENIRTGMLVLIVDERLPPTRWIMGRITELHAGSDGLVRVVTVKTATSHIKRAIHKLVPLPIAD